MVYFVPTVERHELFDQNGQSCPAPPGPRVNELDAALLSPWSFRPRPPRARHPPFAG